MEFTVIPTCIARYLTAAHLEADATIFTALRLNSQNKLLWEERDAFQMH